MESSTLSIRLLQLLHHTQNNVVIDGGELLPNVYFLHRTWEEGKAIIIDDSFDHEVWHNGSSFRLILIVDFWHPDLTPRQRASLTPI